MISDPGVACYFSIRLFKLTDVLLFALKPLLLLIPRPCRSAGFPGLCAGRRQRELFPIGIVLSDRSIFPQFESYIHAAPAYAMNLIPGKRYYLITCFGGSCTSASESTGSFAIWFLNSNYPVAIKEHHTVAFFNRYFPAFYCCALGKLQARVWGEIPVIGIFYLGPLT